MNVTQLRTTRHNRLVRVRHHVRGTTERPRLHVFRSSRYMYAQIIDDEAGKTLVAACEKEIKVTGTKTERAAAIGKLIAEKAKKAKLSKVCFDRGYYNYHGRVKAVAEAARTEGLEF